MGWFNRLKLRLTNSHKRRLLLVGLDSAGKTTILYHLQGRPTQTRPTIGHNAATIKHRGIEYLVWDVAGQEKTRTYWRHYYHATDCVLFVVDCSDIERLDAAKAELHSLCNEAELEGVMLCVIANKTDLPNAVNVSDLTKQLELDSLNRLYHVQPAIAVNGTGLDKAMDWVWQQLKST